MESSPPHDESAPQCAADHLPLGQALHELLPVPSEKYQFFSQHTSAPTGTGQSTITPANAKTAFITQQIAELHGIRLRRGLLLLVFVHTRVATAADSARETTRPCPRPTAR